MLDKQFVNEGAYVFITGRRQAELDAAVKEIGENVTGVQGDVAKQADLDRLYATVKSKKGYIDVLFANDIPVTRLSKLAEGRPNIRDLIKNSQVQLIVNTPTRKGPQTDEGKIRAMALMNRVPMMTTVTAAHAAAMAIIELQKGDWGVRPLQEYVAR